MAPPALLDAPPRTTFTVESFWDFLHRPENLDRDWELHRGELVEMPRPRRLHGFVVHQLDVELGLWWRRHKIGNIATADAGVILSYDPPTVVGPDIAYYTDADSVDELPEKWGDTAPVLAVEVLSPTNKPSEVETKIELYLEAGTKLVWVVDPIERTVSVHRPNRDPEELNEGAELANFPELPGFQCPIVDLFRFPSGMKDS